MSTLETNTNIEFDNKLIDLVRANPLLYEKELRTTPYESMKKKTELWRSIATSLGVDPKYCITRWKNLRDKFRRELQKSREMERKAGGAKNKGSAWHLLDKMRFIESHITHCGFRNTKSPARHTTATWNEMDATEQIIEIVQQEDDPLQEAMDEQTINVEKDKESSRHASLASAATNVVNVKRIEALLEGLDVSNRDKAEKRIVAYLCKCQLKSLNNETVDDVTV